jgi:hypothetical protein
MARESRRKREEKRFGRPERLADMVLCTPPDHWQLGPFVYSMLTRGAVERSAVVKAIETIREDVARATVIAADNVMKFYFDHDKCEWDFHEDFPCSSPPFDLFLIEFGTPCTITVEHGEVRPTSGMPQFSGCLFRAVSAASVGHRSPVVAGDGRITIEKIQDAKWFLGCSILGASHGSPIFLAASRHMAIDEHGKIISGPFTIIQGDIGHSQYSKDQLANSFDIFQIPALLAISFMHCKNVSLSTVDPDRKINQERQKAGLHPFLRYHTINIEPMKQVLRTKGDIESNGLKRALHICCGHFARYVPERGGPFGRKIDEPMMVWHPSHVRGSAKQGVVFSDYNVEAPKEGDEGT